MKTMNIPVKDMGKFAGKWVVIDPMKNTIIAVGESLKDIDSLITRPADDPKASGTVPAAFKVPYKDEGPYILIF